MTSECDHEPPQTERAVIPERYVWLVWASAFLAPWGVVYWRFPEHRHAMRWASLFTMPFGLTEPLFVPEYWDPPSLFDLAQRTGFDVESLIFCFGIGGVGAVIVNVVTRRRTAGIAADERHHPAHRFHRLALLSPFLVFPVLYLFPWNPIYPSIVAMAVGAVATVTCRPDLRTNAFLGGGIFLTYYLAFLLGLEWTAPGYIERVWNLADLSGIMVGGFPLEELLFAVGFGAYWAGVYEHANWRRATGMAGRGAPGSPSQ